MIVDTEMMSGLPDGLFGGPARRAFWRVPGIKDRYYGLINLSIDKLLIDRDII